VFRLLFGWFVDHFLDSLRTPFLGRISVRPGGQYAILRKRRAAAILYQSNGLPRPFGSAQPVKFRKMEIENQCALTGISEK
jgi:hypothetical protein